MIEQNKNLKTLNTFMVPAVAQYFAVATDNDSLYTILASDEWSESKKHLILGGGSNVLFVQDYDGFVLKNEMKGIDITNENDNTLTIRVGAGENWHNFVMWSVERELWGIENLVYIPGSVGAAPVQNIGAYGVEAKEVIEFVAYIDTSDGKKKSIKADDCEFGYRMSIFKKNPGKYIITKVIFTLQKEKKAELGYGRIQKVLEEKGIENPSSKDIAEIIKEIRQSKLPEVGDIGTAGSFFKNPIIEKSEFEALEKKFPHIVSFDEEGGRKKIPAGWLLDELGYKGFMNGHVGNYEKHALIVVHDGEGTGQEVYDHVREIIKKVKDVFDITLEPEVVIVKSEGK